ITLATDAYDAAVAHYDLRLLDLVATQHVDHAGRCDDQRRRPRARRGRQGHEDDSEHLVHHGSLRRGAPGSLVSLPAAREDTHKCWRWTAALPHRGQHPDSGGTCPATLCRIPTRSTARIYP